ncbi:MAG: M56 family metallopeptidase, partial [Pirellulales bacterium]
MDVSWFERLVAILATYWIHSTCLIGGLWICLRWRKVASAANRQAAWKLALTLGLVTAPLQWWMPLTPWSGQLRLPSRLRAGASWDDPASRAMGRQSVGADTTGIGSEPVDAASSLFLADSTAGAMASALDSTGETPLMHGDTLAPPAQNQSSVSIPSNRPTLFNWTLAVGLAWIAACLVGLARMASLSLQLGRSGLEELKSGPEQELLRRLLGHAGLKRRVRLYRWLDGTSAVAWGLWRWNIAVPPCLLQRLNRRELKALFAHELGHLVRGDTRWLWLGGAIGAVGFFQPLNRLAQRQIRREAETLSDRWAVAQTNDPLALARCLTVAAELLAGKAPAFAAPVVGGGSPLAERVDQLLKDRHQDAPRVGKLARGLWSCATICLVLAVVGLVPGVRLADGQLLRAAGGSASSDIGQTGELLFEEAASARPDYQPGNAGGAIQPLATPVERAGSQPPPAGEANSDFERSLAALWNELDAMEAELADLDRLLTGAIGRGEAALLGRIKARRREIEAKRGALRHALAAGHQGPPAQRGAKQAVVRSDPIYGVGQEPPRGAQQAVVRSDPIYG